MEVFFNNGYCQMTESNTIPPQQPARLPCRGCTAACKQYAICEGKPWRLTVERLEQHNLSN